MRVLAISQDAAEAIKRIVDSSEVPGQGGIRISVEPVDENSARFDLSLTDHAEPGDALVEEKGANVFLEENAARVLDDKVLDASVDGNTVSFSITDQQDFSQNGQPEKPEL